MGPGSTPGLLPARTLPPTLYRPRQFSFQKMSVDLGCVAAFFIYSDNEEQEVEGCGAGEGGGGAGKL